MSMAMCVCQIFDDMPFLTQQNTEEALSNNQIMRGPYVNTGSKDIGPDVPRK